MEVINPILPAWISRQATLQTTPEANVKVDGKYTLENAFFYSLSVLCPQIFEKYAIILHPFWIDLKAMVNLKDHKRPDYNSKTDIRDIYKRISWQNLFRLYNRPFDLSTAYITLEGIHEEKADSPSAGLGTWYSDHGDTPIKESLAIRDILMATFGDIPVTYFYCILKTVPGICKYLTWADVVYRGDLSEFEKLASINLLNGNPSAIFPDDKQWCIVSDYDCPFTFVGGSANLIDQITALKDFEIFELPMLFKEII